MSQSRHEKLSCALCEQLIQVNRFNITQHQQYCKDQHCQQITQRLIITALKELSFKAILNFKLLLLATSIIIATSVQCYLSQAENEDNIKIASELNVMKNTAVSSLSVNEDMMQIQEI
jgi:hypothetical protein